MIELMVTSDENAAFSARLNEALDDFGCPPKFNGRQKYVAKLFGISQRAARKWLEAEGFPESARWNAIAEKLQVNFLWLFSGKGPKKSEYLFDVVAPQNVRESNLSHYAPGARIMAPDFRKVPIISYAQAGEHRKTIDQYFAGLGLDVVVGVDPVIAKELSMEAFALIIEGGSMSPEFNAGDVVVVEPNRTPQPGSIVVAKLEKNDVVIVRKYRARTGGVVELMPINQDYASELIDQDNAGSIVGVVVEHRRKLI